MVRLWIYIVEMSKGSMSMKCNINLMRDRVLVCSVLNFKRESKLFFLPVVVGKGRILTV